jgi:hypothetical protein
MLQIFAVSYRRKMSCTVNTLPNSKDYNNEKYTSLRMRMLIESPVSNRSSLTTACIFCEAFLAIFCSRSMKWK